MPEPAEDPDHEPGEAWGREAARQREAVAQPARRWSGPPSACSSRLRGRRLSHSVLSAARRTVDLQKVMDMEILRRKDVYDHEAARSPADAEEYGPPARWYGHGCAAAGFAPGSVVYAYYLSR